MRPAVAALANMLYFNSFEAVLSAVESGLCKFGVLPIEHSSNGSVRAVYSLLPHQQFPHGAEPPPRRHDLLVMPGAKIEDITEIYSHQQALGQCEQCSSAAFQGRAGHPVWQHGGGGEAGRRERQPPRGRHLLTSLRHALRP